MNDEPRMLPSWARAVLIALQKTECVGQIYELGGPAIYTFRELMEFICRTIGYSRYLVNVPLGILGIVLVTLFFDNPKEDEPRPLDWIGFLLTGVSLSCILYGIEAIGRGLNNAPVAVGLLVSENQNMELMAAMPS